ncbi:MAG: hypothetical protein M0R76_03985 [Proteobacteria bacterium]|nr:hypothetical protein [Pseudomonadota bacterium]
MKRCFGKHVSRGLFAVVLLLLGTACSRSPEGTRDGDCDDQIDNDGNGLVDCEDPGCRLDDVCVAAAARAALAAEKARRDAQAKVPLPADTEAEQPFFSVSGLMVQRGHNGKDIDRAAAINYCRQLDLGGFRDWRLPTQEEALTAFHSKQLAHEELVMWTSTDAGPKSGIIVGITTGAVNDLPLRLMGQCRARCVREIK